MEVDEEKLARAVQFNSWGLKNATGLTARDQEGHEQVIQATREQLGHWSTARGQLVVVTQDGEVWFGPASITKAVDLATHCPAGRGDFDFHDPDKGILLRQLLPRIMKDPYADPNESDAVPVPPKDGSSALQEVA